MTDFDPFGDYHQKGYLHNVYKLPLGKKLKRLEHQRYEIFLPEALAYLATRKRLQYQDLLMVNRKLFGGLYPWAGTDRLKLTPQKTVFKGKTIFAEPRNIQPAFELAMRSSTIGKTLGNLAYAHPFLECNGRTIFTFVEDLLRRKGQKLMWTSLPKNEFLQNIDNQINQPNSSSLDEFLALYLQQLLTEETPKGIELARIKWFKSEF